MGRVFESAASVTADRVFLLRARRRVPHCAVHLHVRLNLLCLQQRYRGQGISCRISVAKLTDPDSNGDAAAAFSANGKTLRVVDVNGYAYL